MTRIRSIDELDLSGKRLLLRLDLNCPLTPDGQVADDSRILASLPTIKHAKQAGAKLILCSHLGRPKGKVKKELSLQPVGHRLAELLGQEIFFPEDCIGDGPRRLALNLRDGQVMLLENLRFHPGEEQDDETFAKALASLGQVYVNDAFGAAHRAHASVHAVAKMFPDRAAGLLMLQEIKALRGLLDEPARPFVAVVGGAKIESKIGVIEHLLGLCDQILIGGAMAYTFLAALEIPVGQSLVEHDKIPLARRALLKAEAKKVPLMLPVDHRCATSIEASAEDVRTFVNGSVPADQMALDIGPETLDRFLDVIGAARTVFWNGPMGVFEREPFAAGTLALAHGVAKARTSVVGGGDSIAAIRKAGVTPFITHVSTGGGASLEFLEGREMPGIEALEISRRGQEF